MYQDTFFGEVISREGVQLDPKKLCLLAEMPHLIIGSCNHFRYNELMKKGLTLNCRSM